MSENKGVKTFVQGTLGCQCPEEVFEHIERRSDVEVSSRIKLREKIVVGNRLLIYVAAARDIETLSSIMPILITAGREERDREGLNRFRLVLSTGSGPKLGTIAEEIFKASSDVDEKMHLHIITNDELDTLDRD